MKRTSILVAVAVALTSLLAGCHGESVTGPPAGNHTLTGQVVPVGDLAGSSPAGITVTCSGQVGVTDAAGRFAFNGLAGATGQYTILSTGFASGNLQLNFSRADGISASGSVSADAASVVVNLQKKQAAIVVTGLSKREIEGLVTAISLTSITVNDASTGGLVTAAITTSTVIRKGNQTLTWDKLNKGDRVHVKASVNGDSLTAFEIMLQQSGGDGGQTRELEGPITAVSDKSITVDNASTGQPETAAITKNTVIRKGNTTLTWDNLNVGDLVHVKTIVNADSTLTATEIMLQNPAN